MKIIISDTGPILHLIEADALFLLSRAGDVIVPPAVDKELAEKNPDWNQLRPDWLHIEELTPQENIDAMLWVKSGDLDIGEAEAIAMAHYRRPDWLLTDDATARLFATVMGCEVHGSLGVILWGAVNRYIEKEEAKIYLDRLVKSSLWISQSIINEARKMLEE